MPEGVEAKTAQTIDLIEATLARQGLTLADVVSSSCFLTDNAELASFNTAPAACFSNPPSVSTAL